MCISEALRSISSRAYKIWPYVYHYNLTSLANSSRMKQGAKLVIYNWLTKILPATSICQRFRIACLRWAGVKIGDSVEIGDGVVVRGDGEIIIGDRVRIYDDVYILCKRGGIVRIGSDVTLGTRAYFESGGRIVIGDRTGIWQSCILTANCGSNVEIGSDCKIAHMTSLKTTTHVVSPNEVCIGGDDQYKDIHIGAGSWLCAGSIVLPGVSIGCRCLVAAGAVVTKDTLSAMLVAGVPAIVKKRYG